MRIDKIRLSDFRNFKEKLLEFSPEKTIIVGPNASGKSNILEGIFLLSRGKSFRTRLEEEMIRYSQEISRVKGRIQSDGDRIDLEVILTRGEIKIEDSSDKYQKAARKKLLVNSVSKRLFNFAGNLKVILFGPWDLELVTESPSIRRKFLDGVLSQVDKEYRRASLSYERALRQRNRLLLKIRDEGASRSQLIFWDRLIIKNGDYISRKREEFIEFCNSNKSHIVSKELNSFWLEYDKSAISETRLEQYAKEEVAAATTLIGPHRDDFIFKIQDPKSKIGEERELSRFGSRGEQRMGDLWLKLAELSFIESVTGEKPTLLLDDIFSELDHKHREIVSKVACGQQTIITTADPHFIKDMKAGLLIKL